MDVVADWSSEFLEKQKNEIGELMKTQLSDEATWYLVDKRWFKQWKKYVGFDTWEGENAVGEKTSYPGPIDNRVLLQEDQKTLKPGLTDDIEYSLLPKGAWDKLLSWYRLQEGQEPIERHVIPMGVFVKHLRVEVYFIELELCLFADPSNVVKRSFSNADSIADLERVIREVFPTIAGRDIHLWSCCSNTHEPLTRSTGDNSLPDAGLYNGQTVMVEVRSEDGSWPQPRNAIKSNAAYMRGNTNSSLTTNSGPVNNSTSAASNRYYPSGSYGSNSYFDSCRNVVSPGLCGLGNLGNTCFMNSAIQCLSNVPSLTTFMVTERWKAELNADNPLGMNGEIASSYAELIKNMWSGKLSCVVPRAFKIAVGRFKPEFSGYQQQDSQELMAFLLDGLHEDLNRIRQKPYVETKEANNRPDREVAMEAWSDYIKRNDSIIVDIFHGLLKSTLVCPECSKVSVKFDPFCYLSLPLPVKKERQIEIILVPWDPMKKLRQCKVTVMKMGVISQLCTALSQITKIPPEKMLVVDVYNHRFHRIFNMTDAISHILERDDIFVYEMPVDVMATYDMKFIPVYMRLDRSLFGVPTMIAVRTKGCTYDVLYNCILDRMERIIRRPDSQGQPLPGGHNDDSDRQSLEDDTVNEDDEGSSSNCDKSEQKSSESASSSEDVEENGTADDDISDCDEHSALLHNAASSGAGGAATSPARLFSLSFVNIYGTADVSRLSDENKPIKFSGQHMFLAADWTTKTVEKFYDEKSAEDLDVDESMATKPVQKKQTIQLAECLDLFTTKELLGEHDLWFCPVCKRHEQATKKFDIWQLPEVLVIHLKRFSYTRYWRDKLDAFVDFPTRGLDVSPCVINPEHEPAVYDLIAISNHYGGMGGGHYTAYAKNVLDNTWYHFDDSSVSATTEDAVVTKAAYVLVYARRKVERRGSCADRPSRSTSSASSSSTFGPTEVDNIQQLDSDDDEEPVDGDDDVGPMETN